MVFPSLERARVLGTLPQNIELTQKPLARSHSLSVLLRHKRQGVMPQFQYVICMLRVTGADAMAIQTGQNQCHM